MASTQQNQQLRWNFVSQLWYVGLCGLLIINTVCAAQSQVKRSSRITSSRSFGTNVKSSSSNGISFDCPEEFGYYPHPTDCTQYYVCVFGGALLESCTGGLMYSHELQTCDWPRNVGCEVVDNSAATSSGSHESQSRTNQQQAAPQQQQHVPSRVRFGSAFTSAPAGTPSPAKGTVRPEYHRSPPQAIQAQVQTIPPPPELKVPPNPVITSRGQPKPLLDSHEDDIAKLYAEAHESLPAVEEEETDRQQRVYRGQPSTVSQVQRDRDGIIHQASINAIPNQGKIGSFAFGSQYRENNIDLDYVDNGLDTNNNKTRRKRDLNETSYQNDNLTLTDTEMYALKNGTDYVEASQEFIDDVDYDDYMDINDTLIEESRRRPRQLRPSYAALRSRWTQPTLGSTKYHATDPKKYQQQQQSQPSFTFGSFNPYLSPPSQSLNQLSPGYQVYQNVQQQSYTKKPKVVYTGYNLSLPPGPPPKIEDDFRPIVGYYNTGSTTTTHAPRPQTNLLPYILQSLKEINEHRNKVQAENFAYFHLDNDPITQNPKSVEAHTVAPILQYSVPKYSKPSQKVTPNSHYSPISTVGGFYNNNQPTLLDFKPTSKVTSRYNIGETQLPLTSTEPNYFQYNILANQQIKNYQANPAIGTENSFWSTSKPLQNINTDAGHNNYTLPEFHPSFSGGVISTATPTTTTTQKSLLQLEFNIPDFVSSLQPTDLANVNPQVMEMLKYFKQLNINTKHLNGRRPIPQKLNNFKTTESLELSTEQYRFRAKTTLNKQQNSLFTTTERPPKGYESFINSIPSQSTVFQTTTKQYANDYYEEQYAEEETLGNDSDDETHPPAKMPPYMPMSETMAPPRVQIMEPATTKTPVYLDTSTTRRPYTDLKPLNFGQHTEHGQTQIPSFIQFPSDFFQELKTRPPLKHENKIESTTLATTTLRLTFPVTTPSSTTSTTKLTTRLISTTARSRPSLRPTRQRGQNKWQLNKVNTFKTRNHNNKTDFNVNNFRKQRPSAAPSTAALGILNFNVNTNSDLDALKNR